MCDEESQEKIKLEIYQHLAQSADDIKLGRVQDVESVFDEIMRDFSYVIAEKSSCHCEGKARGNLIR